MSVRDVTVQKHRITHIYILDEDFSEAPARYVFGNGAAKKKSVQFYLGLYGVKYGCPVGRVRR